MYSNFKLSSCLWMTGLLIFSIDEMIMFGFSLEMFSPIVFSLMEERLMWLIPQAVQISTIWFSMVCSGGMTSAVPKRRTECKRKFKNLCLHYQRWKVQYKAEPRFSRSQWVIHKRHVHRARAKLWCQSGGQTVILGQNNFEKYPAISLLSLLAQQKDPYFWNRYLISNPTDKK